VIRRAVVIAVASADVAAAIVRAETAATQGVLLVLAIGTELTTIRGGNTAALVANLGPCAFIVWIRALSHKAARAIGTAGLGVAAR
jgi:hypothetical protein